MNVMKKSLALLLVFVLALSCLPLGAVTAFAAENEETQPPTEVPDTIPTEATETQPNETEEAPTEAATPEAEPVEETTPAEEEPSRGPMMFAASPASDDSGSSGSEVGDGGDGSGNTAGDGSSKVVILLMLMVFISGLCFLLYPYLQGAIADYRITQEAHEFLEKVDNWPTKPEETIPIVTEPPVTEPEETEPVLYPELLAAMESYNQQIWEEKQAGLCDPWAYEQPSFKLGDYGLEDEVFGVISIPRLQLEMPIYLGATYKHMADGAAHLSQTSLPIGGENTNCVIAGHRGWGGASYFRYITELEAGDEVIITNLWGELRYTVVETKIIDPNDVKEILIQQDRELLTLLTCHPYASGGKYRYVVYCERDYEMEVK